MRLTRLFVVLSVFCGLAHVTPARAQERTAVNSVFAEGLGPGLAYSLNMTDSYAPKNVITEEFLIFLLSWPNLRAV